MLIYIIITPYNVHFQREESMKRLLEWKQRMLQSPLTKKSSSRSGSSSPAVGLYSSSSRSYLRSKTPDGTLNTMPYEVRCSFFLYSFWNQNRIISQSLIGYEVDYWSKVNYVQKISLYQPKNMSYSPYSFRGGVPGVMGPPLMAQPSSRLCVLPSRPF